MRYDTYINDIASLTDEITQLKGLLLEEHRPDHDEVYEACEWLEDAIRHLDNAIITLKENE